VSLVGTLLGIVLTVFIVVMIVRLVLDWVAVATRMPPWLRQVGRLTHAATEPVIAPVRRVLRPVRFGAVAIDLAFTVVFVVALILRAVAYSL
jgi:YggT family protein